MVGTGISFAALLYRPIFDRLGVSAKLTLVKGVFDIVALDKTVGASVVQNGGITIETMKPQAELMMVDLTALGLTQSDLEDGTITMFPPGADTSDTANGKTWHVTSYKLNPSNSGIQDGTIYLQLEGDSDD